MDRLAFGKLNGSLINLFFLSCWRRINCSSLNHWTFFRAVSSILSTLLFPIFPAMWHLGSLVYVIVIGLFLWTIKFEETWKEWTFIAVHIIGFIWFYCFVTALGEMILASTFATWYWTFKKRDVPFFALATGAWRTIRFNFFSSSEKQSRVIFWISRFLIWSN